MWPCVIFQEPGQSIILHDYEEEEWIRGAASQCPSSKVSWKILLKLVSLGKYCVPENKVNCLGVKSTLVFLTSHFSFPLLHLTCFLVSL